jgi:caffeoyl-CoA O-methyltransferase
VSKFTSLTPELHRYMVESGARQDDVLRRLEHDTAERFPDLRQMQIAPDQGAFLTLLARSIGARRAIEAGTFTGYSAICIARGLAADGELVACELRPEFAEIARDWFAQAGVAERIDLRVGPAIETLRALPAEESFDLAFIDADKTGYPDYYEECLARLRPGGVVLLDNALMDGRVLDPAPDDESARTVAELNERLGGDERVDIALVGIADGLMIARKR